jgi:hypothetical protein
MLRDELWCKYDIEWCDHGRQALTRVVHAEAGRMPFVGLHPPDKDGELYWVDDGIDDKAEELYIERSYAKPLPLTNKDLLELARELNEWCRER